MQNAEMNAKLTQLQYTRKYGHDQINLARKPELVVNRKELSTFYKIKKKQLCGKKNCSYFL